VASIVKAPELVALIADVPLPTFMVPLPESSVRSRVAPIDCKVTLPSLAAALVICRKWEEPLAVWRWPCRRFV
jgi:hypothetical protein